MTRRDFYGRPAAVYVIVRDGSKILMLKRIGPWKPGEFVPPSGHVEAKETLRSAAQRELKEEVNLEVKLSDLEFKFVTHRFPGPDEVDDREYLDFYFEAKKWSGQLTNREPDKHSEVAWIDMDELDEYPVVNYVKSALGAIEQGVSYGEFDW